MKSKLLYCLLAVMMAAGLLVTSCGGGTSNQPPATTNTGSPSQTTSISTSGNEISVTLGDGTVIKFKNTGAPPPILEDLNKKYTATIETEVGNLVIELFAKDVPKAVSNFVYLATKGYYDNTTFHRVIPGFMAQGGDPTGTGRGGPGYTFGLEITNHKHVTGAVSMANTGAPNSNGSQFFICYADQPFLDGKYSVFGQLTSGMDVLEKLTPRDPDTNPSFNGTKVYKIVISVQ